MNEMIKNADTATLWALVVDVSEIMTQREYIPAKSDTVFMFWYGVYKLIETEIDRRLVIGDTEG